MTERTLPDGCPTCGALPCDWAFTPTPAADEVEAVRGVLDDHYDFRLKPHLAGQPDLHLHAATKVIAAMQARSAEPAKVVATFTEDGMGVRLKDAEPVMIRAADGSVRPLVIPELVDGPLADAIASTRQRIADAVKDTPIVKASLRPAETAGEEPVVGFREWLAFSLHQARYNLDAMDPKAADILANVLARYEATPKNPPFTITTEELGAIMQDEWGDICEDAQAHPEDIRREGRKLFYLPRHWAAAIADRLNARHPEPATPTNPERLVEAARQMADALTKIDNALSGRVHSHDAIAALSAGQSAYDGYAALSAAPLKEGQGE